HLSAATIAEMNHFSRGLLFLRQPRASLTNHVPRGFRAEPRLCISFPFPGGTAMSAIKITIHSTGSGCCSLTNKETDGLSVTFEDGTVNEAFLSWKAFRQLLALKTNQNGKPAPAHIPTATQVTSGNP